MDNTMTYIKEAFYPQTLQQAKDICITPNNNNPNKFEKETLYTIQVIENEGLACYNSEVADFGCGMGRISKAVIDRFGSFVTGFDISETMLNFAVDYILSKKYTPVLYSKDISVDDYKEKYDLVIILFVLQHSEHPLEDISFINTILKPEGKVLLINEKQRFVPTFIDNEGFIDWIDDGIIIEKELSKFFSKESEHPYPNRYDNKLSVWKKLL
jgi:2-polyprenyl-3-methyl-5-hydroxy-6-metoxy-1,4-benzoquinol methylase